MAEYNSKPTCQNCSYFLPESHAGLCQRYPQYITKHHNNWCGEHKPSKVQYDPVPAIHIEIKPQEPTHAITHAPVNVEVDKLQEIKVAFADPKPNKRGRK